MPLPHFLALILVVLAAAGLTLWAASGLGLSLGLMALGLGMVGLLKTAIEMREHHRLDRGADGASAGSRA